MLTRLEVDRRCPLRWFLHFGATVLTLLATATLLQPAPLLADDTGGGKSSAGRAALEAACTNCHAIGMVTSVRRSPVEWDETLERMAGFGAQLTDAQRAEIRSYLIGNLSSAADGGALSPTAAMPEASAQPARHFPRPTGPNQWPAYGGGGSNQNFSPLTEITPANVARMKPAWTYHTGGGRSNVGDEGLDFRSEATPLLIGGVMYISYPTAPSTPNLKSAIVALNPQTGAVIWKYESPVNIHGRGVAYWPGDEATPPRIIFATAGGLIMALDVTTGRLAPGFGRNGQIDAYIGVASEIVGESRRSSWNVPNPVTIYKNLIITGARPEEVGPPQPRGDIRAWDARTGRLVWSFHTVPQPGEKNHEGYTGDEWRDVSGANVWSTMALDETNGILYAPLGDLNSNAAGPQLYSDTLVALDAATGTLRRYRQITHHDIWDWDLPTPPMLIDVDAAGKKVPAVLVTSKHGLLFMFNRLTGESINGFDETPTPRPDPGVAGEVWPTQPFPRGPEPLARTQMTRDEIPDLAPGMRAACTKYWDDNHIVSAPLYSPRKSTLHGTLSYPGPVGGPNWGGAAFYPSLGLYVIGITNQPVYLPQIKSGEGGQTMNRGEHPPPTNTPLADRPTPLFSFRLQSSMVISCGAPPYVDVNRQRIAWRVPFGRLEAVGAHGAHLGTTNRGGAIVTASGVLFTGATNDRRFRAYDVKNGKVLWEVELEAGAHATPVTYMGADGKQYVVIVAGGGLGSGWAPQRSDTIVAYALP